MLFAGKRDTHVDLSADHLSFGDSAFKFDEILHLSFSWVNTSVRVNFVKAPDRERAYLNIVLTNGERINLSFDEGGSWWRDVRSPLNLKREIKTVVDIYKILADRTFANRVLFYTEQLKQRGYFVYDDCRFYPGDKIIYKNKEFHIKSTKFLKYAESIVMRQKKESLVDILKREIVEFTYPQFRTVVDPDVIFYLLKQHFGLSWSQS